MRIFIKKIVFLLGFVVCLIGLISVAMNHFFLVEKTHPGYFDYLDYQLGFNVNNGNEIGRIYKFSVYANDDVTNQDYNMFFRQSLHDLSYITLDLCNGYGITMDKSKTIIYGELDTYAKVKEPIETLQKGEVKSFLSKQNRELTLGKVNELYTYLKILKNTDYDIAISVKDDAYTWLGKRGETLLNDLGLQKGIAFGERYVAYIQKGEIIFEEQSSSPITFQEKDIAIVSDMQQASIFFFNQNYSRNHRGINIVVYDSENKSLVDSVCFDTYDRRVAYRNEIGE